jgi:hypothetical protein
MNSIHPRTACIPPVRCTPAELRAIKRNAKSAGMTTAAWVRWQSLAPKTHSLLP